MSGNIKLKKGFDINLAGKADKKVNSNVQVETFALKPTDFVGMIRPKSIVQEGDMVKAGTPILLDKKMEQVLYTSPVSGEIVEVKRGEKRRLLEIKILADKEVEFETFKKYTVSDIIGLSREEAQDQILKSGVWPQIIQRPFAVVANPLDTPRAIFISSFDTSPLAPSYDYLLKGQEKYVQAGINILKKFTKGTVHIGLNGDDEASPLFEPLKGVTLTKYSGIHPAGNVGVHIHHTDSIKGGNDLVWTISPYGVAQIGKLFLEGVYDASKLIAVAGSEIQTPQYVKTYLGASTDSLTKGNLKSDNVRIVSGNVLTGEEAKGSYVGFYDHLVTAIPEGNNPRFMITEGWLSITSSRLSFHRAFGLFSFLNPKKEFVLDTNANGQHRAFVMTGAFEKVVPMDILPTHLIKAILAEDYEEMEALGIYEVAEEDLALCEFIDVSKHDIQKIVRTGIELLRLS